MKIKRIVPFVVAVALFLGVIALSSGSQDESAATVLSQKSSADEAKAATKDESAKNKASETDEMRGVWVTYMELDMQKESDKSENSFREKFEAITQNSLDCGFNTLIVQVRPFGDALYESEYFPWSHLLTGEQGKNPGYDPLEIMCEICRDKGLQIHAWVNPYRIKLKETPNTLSDDNPYVKNVSLGKETDGGIFYDPSSEEARELIVNGVREIVENYDIDAVQFDDYFYPTDDKSFDKDEYNVYVESTDGGCMSLDNWRLANVNMLVCETYRAVHDAKENVQFGISPQGNIENNEKLYADVKSWCNCKGFIDYICPQLYFSEDNPALGFEDALESWTKLSFDENVKLYVGLAGYKAASEDDEGTWRNRSDILSKEYQLVKKDNKADGVMLYSYCSLIEEDKKEEISNLSKAFD